MASKHIFAVYLSEQQAFAEKLTLTQHDLVHRITVVLRLAEGDDFILFTPTWWAQVTLHTIAKKHVLVTCKQRTTVEPLKPEMHWILPILSKDAFENALHHLAVLGVHTIYPVVTQKIHRQWIKETDRLQRILIAGCEQAKQFCVPVLYPVQPLEKCLALVATGTKVWFDPEGVPANAIAQLSTAQKLIVAVGPEGDFSLEEKELLTQAGFMRCALTPTILRAEDAVLVGGGVVRSLLR